MRVEARMYGRRASEFEKWRMALAALDRGLDDHQRIADRMAGPAAASWRVLTPTRAAVRPSQNALALVSDPSYNTLWLGCGSWCRNGQSGSSAGCRRYWPPTWLATLGSCIMMKRVHTTS